MALPYVFQKLLSREDSTLPRTAELIPLNAFRLLTLIDVPSATSEVRRPTEQHSFVQNVPLPLATSFARSEPIRSAFPSAAAGAFASHLEIYNRLDVFDSLAPPMHVLIHPSASRRPMGTIS
jgi:hypothetical protein